MAQSDLKLAGCVAVGAGVLFLIWKAMSQNEDSYVPPKQTEGQLAGFGIGLDQQVGAGTYLDTNHPDHGWYPGYDPDPSAQPVTYSKHRYPAVPGGNISTVMHQGWGSMVNKAPADWEWMLNPPEASVL